MGSLTTGLGSRQSLGLDFIVSMDGGHLTDSLSGDQLAVALSKGLTDWNDLASLEAVGEGSSILSISTSNSQARVRIFACKPSTFPLNFLNHTLLFSSYALCDPRAPIVVSLIKQWATSVEFSSPDVKLSCPFSGFHWTILILYFLVDVGVLPNLHKPTVESTEITKVIYGPNPERHSFACIKDPKHAQLLLKGSPGIADNVFQLCSGFFDWLASIDLLTVVIDMRLAGSGRMTTSNHKGWISIADPAMPGFYNTVNTFAGQKSQVEFALKLRKLASTMPAKLRGSTEATFIKSLMSRANTTGPSLKIDKAVP